MDKFIRNLLTEWRKLKLPLTDATVVVAVSGGADSVSLAVALNELRTRGKLNLRFVIAHFNHNLRGKDGDQDEQFVRHLAESRNLELALGTNENAKETGNLEQNARAARYEFLAQTAENLDARCVLTAHTLNDQAETFLFNLMRGSGLDGLGAMKPIRLLEEGTRIKREEEKVRREVEETLGGHEISSTSALLNSSFPLLVRPLLNWAKREDTENFCLLNKIEFRFDAMNEDLKFNRVRIRKILLPLLKDFNPKIVETLAKTAELLRADAEHLSVVRRPSSAAKITNDGQPTTDDGQRTTAEDLPLKDLTDVFPSMRKIILRDWLKRNRGNLRRLQLSHIEAVERLIFSRKSGRAVELPGGECVIKKAGKLVFQKTKVEK